MKRIVCLAGILGSMGLVLMLGGCEKSPEFVRTTDGVIVSVAESTGGVQKVKIAVIADNIVRVSATPSDSFSTVASLAVLPNSGPSSPFDISAGRDTVKLLTKKIRVAVALKTGAVTFCDSAGKLLLREASADSRKFLPSPEVDGCYSVQQSFESPADEAFYGLGAHQNGQMNYKGEDVELVQHNIADVVPFLYSSFNYGILWDNYSVSRFGDTREYEPLEGLKLLDEKGEEGGLTASWYVKDKVVRTAKESRIEFEYLETPQVDSFPAEVARSGKVVWQGFIASEKEGQHKFQVYSSGYLTVWIDGAVVIENWRQGWNPWTNKFQVALRKGEQKKIKIEWNPDGGAYLAVKHLDPLPDEEQNRLTLSSEVADQIDYYFVQGRNADEVISGYRKLTGKAPIVPRWALGFWQSRERYKSQEELVQVVKEYRKRRIPLDNIVLDWQYWEDPKWGSHEFDRSRFPDPSGMIESLHKDLHAQIMISVWPKFNTGTSNYEEMKSKGFLFTHNVEKKRKDWVGVGYESTFYDPFNKEAGKLFWQQIDRNLNTLGTDAWWLDATEPDMHSNLSISERKKNMSPTAIGPGEKYFNAYSLVNARSVYEGQRKSSPEKRVFILTRSAFAGQQRYGAATWSGDIASRWSDFGNQISAGINFSLSGLPYWTMDIGGFSVEKRYERAQGEDLKEWRELNTRWFQFGAFCPLFRSHGQYPYREIFNIAGTGDVYYNSMVYYSRLRYRLLPYLYSIAGHSFFNDYTIMRGLVMDFAEDERVREIPDQYMLGPSLLINPVHEYKATRRQVYLPSTSGWYDFYSGEYLKGGQTVSADAPVERMPIYVRAGSILPVGPELQYAMEKSDAPVSLYIYTGADGAFTLYDDEGVNYNYEQGNYSMIPMRYNEEMKTLTIGAVKGGFAANPAQRTFHIFWVRTDHPVGAGSQSRPDQVVVYQGKDIIINMR